MKAAQRVSRALGAAFLLQFITSFSSGVFLLPLWLTPDNPHETLLKIASRPWLLKLNILVDVVTALGIIFLGVMLYAATRRANEKLALTALGFYLTEATLLAVSRGEIFSLIGISQAYVAQITTGQSDYLQALAASALASMDFLGSTLHMLTFCPGGILFYFLLYNSRVIPRALSLWGLVTILPLLAMTLLGFFDVSVPFVVAVPYVPFEFVVGLWILIKGIREDPISVAPSQAVAQAAI